MATVTQVAQALQSLNNEERLDVTRAFVDRAVAQACVVCPVQSVKLWGIEWLNRISMTASQAEAAREAAAGDPDSAAAAYAANAASCLCSGRVGDAMALSAAAMGVLAAGAERARVCAEQIEAIRTVHIPVHVVFPRTQRQKIPSPLSGWKQEVTRDSVVVVVPRGRGKEAEESLGPRPYQKTLGTQDFPTLIVVE